MASISSGGVHTFDSLVDYREVNLSEGHMVF